MNADARPARLVALFQVGCLSSRASRACVRACFFFSSALERTPGPPSGLDRPGGVTAVLAPALALGLCHCHYGAYAL